MKMCLCKVSDRCRMSFSAKCPNNAIFSVAKCPRCKMVVAKWSIFIKFSRMLQSVQKRIFFRCKMSALQNGRCKMVNFYQIFSNVAKCPKNAFFSVAKCPRCKMVVAKWSLKLSLSLTHSLSLITLSLSLSLCLSLFPALALSLSLSLSNCVKIL